MADSSKSLSDAVTKSSVPAVNQERYRHMIRLDTDLRNSIDDRQKHVGADLHFDCIRSFRSCLKFDNLAKD